MKDNVYEGEPDSRQGDTRAPNTSVGDKLFRKKYSKLTEEEIALHDKIKDAASNLADLYAEVEVIVKAKQGDHSNSVVENAANNQIASVVLGVRHLEDSVYRVVKALTAGE